MGAAAASPVLMVIFTGLCNACRTAASNSGCFKYRTYIFGVVITSSAADSIISECSTASARCICFDSVSAACNRDRTSPEASGAGRGGAESDAADFAGAGFGGAALGGTVLGGTALGGMVPGVFND